LEAQKLAEAQKIKDSQARQKAEAESKERERLLALAAEEEKKKTQEAERQRLKAEADAKEREKQLALAAEQEKQKALAAQQAIAKAKAEEAQRLKEIELAKLQVAEEVKRNKGSSEEAKEKQFAIEKADWDKIKDSKNAEDFYAYLNKYPSGMIAQKATFALEQLDKAKITSQADRNGLVQKLGESRYRLGDKWVGVRKDDYTGNVIAKGEIKVDRIESGLVYASSNTGLNYIYTLDGGVLRSNTADNTFTYDPPLTNLPGDELMIGKKWSNTTTETSKVRSNLRKDEYKIIAFEEITIPAGTFKAYKIQINGWVGQNRIDNLIWVLPDWGVSLKSIRRVHFPRGSPIRESVELESFVRGPSSSGATSASAN
jgi:chemotaxis protein histidine kinase CheA